MIKTNELRIGNLVFLNDKQKVLEIMDGFDIDEMTENSTVDPIPITEDWLLKAGFKKVGRLFYHESFWACELSSNNELRFEDLDNLYVKYVHQLQNLFYSLVGEDLVFFN